jgi:CHAD domain-containing protein
MPLSEAARRVLTSRLELVREHLPLVGGSSDGDPEHVHQLRVGTRRADAAMRIFRCCLPTKVYRGARERLRTIRRAAGKARDWDVFLIDLRQRLGRPAQAERTGLDFLVGYALGHRHAAQVCLETVEQGTAEPFSAFAAETIAAMRPEHKAEPTLLDLAQTMMPALLGRLEQTASGDLNDYHRLHRVRIAGKRLRYAMEVLAVCFAPPFKEVVYPQVEEMQEVLGRANDSHVACQRLELLRAQQNACGKTWPRVRVGIEGLLHFHEERLVQERETFLAWWAQWKERSVDQMLPELVEAGA